MFIRVPVQDRDIQRCRLLWTIPASFPSLELKQYHNQAHLSRVLHQQASVLTFATLRQLIHRLMRLTSLPHSLPLPHQVRQPQARQLFQPILSKHRLMNHLSVQHRFQQKHLPSGLLTPIMHRRHIHRHIQAADHLLVLH